MRSKLVLAAAFACFAVAPTAHARTEIPYSRAALADPAAVEALYATIEQAARRECRAAGDHMNALGPSARRHAIDVCVATTVEAVIREVGSPELTARHEGSPARAQMASR